MSNSVGYIRQILTFSAVDGPGNRAVVFFQGCNMGCKTCHNPETIPRIPGAGIGPEIWPGIGADIGAGPVQVLSLDQVLAQILPVKAFISGVTLTGGECTLQLPFVMDLVLALKSHGLGTMIDTNGSSPKALAALLPHVEGFLLDIKCSDGAQHLALTGFPLSPVLESFEMLLPTQKLIEVRTVVHPNLPSGPTLLYVAQKLRAHSSGALYKVIAFRPHGVEGEWAHEKPCSRAYLEEMGQMLSREVKGFTSFVLI